MLKGFDKCVMKSNILVKRLGEGRLIATAIFCYFSVSVFSFGIPSQFEEPKCEKNFSPFFIPKISPLHGDIAGSGTLSVKKVGLILVRLFSVGPIEVGLNKKSSKKSA